MILSRTEPVTGFVAFNSNSYWDMIGFSVYTFEGIGVVMPIMQTCSTPESFSKILAFGIGTLVVVYCIFSEICYYALGDELDSPIIISEMPYNNPIIITVQLLYLVNLLCTYPLTLYPVFTILEGELFSNWKKTPLRKWSKNLLRAATVVSQIILSIIFASKLDKFLGLVGALLCAPLAFMLPTMCHYKLLARTKSERMIDLVIIFFSVMIFVLCTYQTLANWNSGGVH